MSLTNTRHRSSVYRDGLDALCWSSSSAPSTTLFTSADAPATSLLAAESAFCLRKKPLRVPEEEDEDEGAGVDEAMVVRDVDAIIISALLLICS